MNHSVLPLDNNGFPFQFYAVNIDWREKEKIRSEINTNYAKYMDLEICAHPSFGLDGLPYIYYFENRGFDNINIFNRIHNNY